MSLKAWGRNSETLLPANRPIKEADMTAAREAGCNCWNQQIATAMGLKTWAHVRDVILPSINLSSLHLVALRNAETGVTEGFATRVESISAVRVMWKTLTRKAHLDGYAPIDVLTPPF